MWSEQFKFTGLITVFFQTTLFPTNLILLLILRKQQMFYTNILPERLHTKNGLIIGKNHSSSKQLVCSYDNLIKVVYAQLM
jgi:hypothetical protein